jgi:kinesin family protein 4/21/27
MADASSSVRVAVRVRPLIAREKVERSSECISVLENEKQIVIGKQKSFTFDHVFAPYATQAEIYEQSVVPLIDSFFEGYNATIFAYGQTGSGKTFTMGSSSNLHVYDEEKGIIPRVMNDIYERMHRKTEGKKHSYELRVQFLEVYGEEMRDLLNPMAPPGGVQIRESENGELQVQGALEEPVSKVADMMQLLDKGTLSRTTGSTLMNAHSSRSHAIFTFTLQSQCSALEDGEEGDSEVRVSKFHFVDLAGSERQKRTGAVGKRLREGIEINKGLLALGNVISALGDEKKRGRVHVPYRDSKLTRMLQDSLGGNSRTLMIACVSPADINFEETLNALKYANRARNIRNKAVVNVKSDPAMAELRRQVELLQGEVVRLQGGKGVPSSPAAIASTLSQIGSSPGGSTVSYAEMEQRCETAESEVLRLLSELKKTKSQMADVAESAVRARAESQFFQMKLEEEYNITLSDDVAGSSAETAAQSDVQSGQGSDADEPATESASSEGGEVKEGCEAENAEGATVGQLKEGQVAGDKRSKDDNKAIGVIATHLREIDSLNQQLRDMTAERDAIELSRADAEEPGLNRQRIGKSGRSSGGGEASNGSGEGGSSQQALIKRVRVELKQEKQLLAGLQADGEGAEEGAQEAAEEGAEEGAEEDGDQSEAATDEVSKRETDAAQEQEEAAIRRVFNQRQQQMGATVVDLSANISLKQDLLKQLERSQVEYDRMKEQYEKKMAEMSEEVRSIQRDRDQLLDEVQNLENGTIKKTEQRSKQLQKQLREKELELAKLQSRQKNYGEYIRVREKAAMQMRQLTTEITQMKQQKTDIARKMSSERKRWQREAAERRREICQLRRKVQKDHAQLKVRTKVRPLFGQKVVVEKCTIISVLVCVLSHLVC